MSVGNKDKSAALSKEKKKKKAHIKKTLTPPRPHNILKSCPCFSCCHRGTEPCSQAVILLALPLLQMPEIQGDSTWFEKPADPTFKREKSPIGRRVLTAYHRNQDLHCMKYWVCSIVRPSASHAGLRKTFSSSSCGREGIPHLRKQFSVYL